MRTPAAALAALMLLQALTLAALPTVGQRVSFSLTTKDGAVISSENLMWDAVVLVFFQHNCPHCRTDLPKLAQALKACRTPLNYAVVAVGVSRDLEADYQFFLSIGAEGWRYADGTGELVTAFQLRATPTWIVLDSSSKVVLAEEGSPSGETLCSMLGGVLGGSGRYPYLLVGSRVDEQRAQEFSSTIGGTVVMSLPERASYIVVGGPFAHEGRAVVNPAKSAASHMGVYFSKAGRSIVMEVRSIGKTYSVSGADWAKRDYAVVFTFREGTRYVAGAMGCTRYGTWAALVWLSSNMNRLSPDAGFVLLWEDANSDGAVQPSEISVVETFHSP